MTKELVEKKNIYQRINAVMEEVEYILKGENAGKGLQYRFVSHDQVTGKLHRPMTKHGIVMLTDVVELSRDGNRTTMRIAVTFVNIDNPEERFTIHSHGDGVDNSDKSIGKCISYAVKYALLKTFCLETGDDVEKDNISHIPTSHETITTDELSSIELAINGYEDIREIILSHLGNLKNLRRDKYIPAMNWIAKMIEQKRTA